MMQDTVDVRFSKSELTSLVKTKGTCVTLAKKTRVVFLLPSQLADIKCGIKDNLDSHLLKYDYETKAIIIGYEKIKILSQYGSICYGYSKIALRIEAHFYLFKPTVGSTLKGVVCKQSGHHLGCLVHKGFNVSIPLGEDDGCGWDYTIGQDVKFTVVKLDLTSGPLPYIMGQLCLDDADRSGSDEVPAKDGAVVSIGAAAPAEGHWEEEEEGATKWPAENAEVAPVSGGEGGRDTLINRLLKTVEMSLGEEKPPSPKKPKQKRTSTGLGGAPDRKSSPKRQSGGGAVEGPESDDTGSIIHRLMEMSRREVLGSPQRGKKRKAADAEGPVVVKREGSLGPRGWSGSSPGPPTEKSVSPESQGSPKSKLRLKGSLGGADEAKLGLPVPELLGTMKPTLPLKAKRKSLTVKSETLKNQK